MLKKQLSIVIVGHVDHGKSTLVSFWFPKMRPLLQDKH